MRFPGWEILELREGSLTTESPYTVDVSIAPGEDTVINVSLPPAGSDGRQR